MEHCTMCPFPVSDADENGEYCYGHLLADLGNCINAKIDADKDLAKRIESMGPNPFVSIYGKTA